MKDDDFYKVSDAEKYRHGIHGETDATTEIFHQ